MALLRFVSSQDYSPVSISAELANSVLPAIIADQSNLTSLGYCAGDGGT